MDSCNEIFKHSTNEKTKNLPAKKNSSKREVHRKIVRHWHSRSGFSLKILLYFYFFFLHLCNHRSLLVPIIRTRRHTEYIYKPREPTIPRSQLVGLCGELPRPTKSSISRHPREEEKKEKKARLNFEPPRTFFSSSSLRTTYDPVIFKCIRDRFTLMRKFSPG